MSKAEAPKASGFGIFLAGHALSTLGSRMQTAAVLWHLYHRTGSAVALGGLAAAELGPLLLLAGAGGVAADRFDRRRLLALTQVLQGVPALCLAALTALGRDSVLLLYAATAVGAAALAFDTAARKALVPRLVGEARLARAVSSVDLVKNLAKLAGPAAMGLVVAGAGLAAVYAVNALSFVLMAAALVAMPRSAGVAPGQSGPAPGMLRSLGEGLRFLRRDDDVRSLMVLDFWANFFAGADVLLPVVADEVLHVGAVGYGLLGSAGAAGALAAGLVLVAAPPRRRLGRLVLGSAAGFAAATVALGVSRSMAACVLSLAAIGAADTVSTVVRNTLLQLRTPDALRGRITAVNLVFSKSGPRLGQVEAGLVAGVWGVAGSIVSGGALCLAAVAWAAWRYPGLRRMDGVTAASSPPAAGEALAP